MRDSLKIALGIILGVIGLGLCVLCAFAVLGTAGITLLASAPTPALPPQFISPLPPVQGTLPGLLPQATATPAPIPLDEGQPLILENFEAEVVGHAVTSCVTLVSGEERCPPEGASYLWVHLRAQHTGDSSALPLRASFSTSVTYLGEPQPDAYVLSGPDDKPFWPGFTDGSGDTQMYAGATIDGWLAFIVPSGFKASDVLVHLDNRSGEPAFQQDWRLVD